MKTLLITGANGFLGEHVTKAIHQKNQNEFEVLTPRSEELDMTSLNQVMSYFDDVTPHVVLHMAAFCGGIGLNKKQPADLTQINLKMGINLFDAVRMYKPDFVYTLGSVCAYPVNCPVPFKEDDIWSGASEETNVGYGFSKRALLMLQQQHKKQYGLKGAHLIPVNMYGAKDHFDLENSHVIPALINKFESAIERNEPVVECWGTGTATREFLYAQDAADAIAKAVFDELDTYDPINLGTGSDISIKDLAYLIAKLTGFKGKIVFTGEVSDGQPKRRLDVSRALKLLNWKAKVGLKEGLEETINWYKQHCKS